MDSQLKELLRDRADEAEIEPTIPAGVVRRARARRRRNVAVTGLVTVALIAGSIAGVRAILDMERPAKPAAEAWAGIWPHDTRAEAAKAQRQYYELATSHGICVGLTSEQCDERLWQGESVLVATRYAEQILGWPQAYPIRRIAGRGSGPVSFELWDRPFDGTRSDFRATVTVERLLRQDRFGIWSVVAADPTVTPSGAESLVFRFLDARLDGAPVDELISPPAGDIYEAGQAGLSLYGGGAGPFIGYEVEERDPAGEDTFLFVVHLFREDATVAESLLVGPGVDMNGHPQPVVVLSVSRDEFREIEETPPPIEDQNPSTEEQIFEFVTQFMELRLAGSGAEDYLATETRLAYESHDNVWGPDEPGLYLYGRPHLDGDPEASYVSYRIEDMRPADASTCSWFSEAACQEAWEVVVLTELAPSDGDQPGTMTELLLVAPADGAAAEFADWMISGAARGAEPPGQ